MLRHAAKESAAGAGGGGGISFNNEWGGTVYGSGSLIAIAQEKCGNYSHYRYQEKQKITLQ